MKEAEIPENEEERLRSLRRLDVLDTPEEEVFDRITRIASAVFGMPISLVSLIDEERQWFKSRVGLDATETPRNISFCGHAIHTDVPLIVPDATKDDRFADNPLVTGELGLRFYAGVPLRIADGARLGTLCIIDQKPRQFSADEIAILSDLAGIAVRELELRRVSLSDTLTGTFNRRMFEKLGALEFSRARRNKEHFCFAILGVDDLDRINDTFGRDAGDTVLVAFARVCEDFLRNEDVFFRLGGAEFGILLGNTMPDAAIDAMNRLRQMVEVIPVDHDDNSIVLTVSAGVAAMGPADMSLDTMVQRADVALDVARKLGCNRVEIN